MYNPPMNRGGPGGYGMMLPMGGGGAPNGPPQGFPSNNNIAFNNMNTHPGMMGPPGGFGGPQRLVENVDLRQKEEQRRRQHEYHQALADQVREREMLKRIEKDGDRNPNPFAQRGPPGGGMGSPEKGLFDSLGRNEQRGRTNFARGQKTQPLGGPLAPGPGPIGGKSQGIVPQLAPGQQGGAQSLGPGGLGNTGGPGVNPYAFSSPPSPLRGVYNGDAAFSPQRPNMGVPPFQFQSPLPGASEPFFPPDVRMNNSLPPDPFVPGPGNFNNQFFQQQFQQQQQQQHQPPIQPQPFYGQPNQPLPPPPMMAMGGGDIYAMPPDHIQPPGMNSFQPPLGGSYGGGGLPPQGFSMQNGGGGGGGFTPRGGMGVDAMMYGGIDQGSFNTAVQPPQQPPVVGGRRIRTDINGGGEDEVATKKRQLMQQQQLDLQNTLKNQIEEKKRQKVIEKKLQEDQERKEMEEFLAIQRKKDEEEEAQKRKQKQEQAAKEAAAIAALQQQQAQFEEEKQRRKRNIVATHQGPPSMDAPMDFHLQPPPHRHYHPSEPSPGPPPGRPQQQEGGGGGGGIKDPFTNTRAHLFENPPSPKRNSFSFPGHLPQDEFVDGIGGPPPFSGGRRPSLDMFHNQGPPLNHGGPPGGQPSGGEELHRQYQTMAEEVQRQKKFLEELRQQQEHSYPPQPSQGLAAGGSNANLSILSDLKQLKAELREEMLQREERHLREIQELKRQQEEEKEQLRGQLSIKGRSSSNTFTEDSEDQPESNHLQPPPRHPHPPPSRPQSGYEAPRRQTVAVPTGGSDRRGPFSTKSSAPLPYLNRVGRNASTSSLNSSLSTSSLPDATNTGENIKADAKSGASEEHQIRRSSSVQWLDKPDEHEDSLDLVLSKPTRRPSLARNLSSQSLVAASLDCESKLVYFDGKVMSGVQESLTNLKAHLAQKSPPKSPKGRKSPQKSPSRPTMEPVSTKSFQRKEPEEEDDEDRGSKEDAIDQLVSCTSKASPVMKEQGGVRVLHRDRAVSDTFQKIRNERDQSDEEQEEVASPRGPVKSARDRDSRTERAIQTGASIVKLALTPLKKIASSPPKYKPQPPKNRSPSMLKHTRPETPVDKEEEKPFKSSNSNQQEDQKPRPSSSPKDDPLEDSLAFFVKDFPSSSPSSTFTTTTATAVPPRYDASFQWSPRGHSPSSSRHASARRHQQEAEDEEDVMWWSPSARIVDRLNVDAIRAQQEELTHLEQEDDLDDSIEQIEAILQKNQRRRDILKHFETSQQQEQQGINKSSPSWTELHQLLQEISQVPPSKSIKSEVKPNKNARDKVKREEEEEEEKGLVGTSRWLRRL